MGNENFCCLCGKQRHEALTNIPLGMIDEGIMVRVDACKGCGVILHNIRRVYEDTRKQWVEKRKKEAQDKLKGGV